MDALQRLTNDQLGTAERAKALQEIREYSNDGAGIPDFANWPSTPFKQYCEVLRSIPVQAEDNAEHKLRYAVLEALVKLPQNEAFKPHSQELFELCLAVVQHDNQENAVLAIKIMFELHKSYKQQMELQAAQFLDLVLQMLKEVPGTVRTELEGHPPDSQPPLYAKVGPTCVPGLKSFKGVVECPLAVMFLLQMYPALVARYLDQLINAMMEAARVPGPGVSAVHTSLVPLLTECRLAQVKSAQYVAHVLRQKPDAVKGHLPVLVEVLVHLLRKCPDNAIASRKELLVAVRQIVNSPLRDVLRTRVDELTDESVLLGSAHGGGSSSASESLRPLAYQVLLEVLNSAKKNMNPAQIMRAVWQLTIICQYSLPAQINHFSLKVLSSTTETIYTLARNPQVDLPTKLHARGLLTRVLDCLVVKIKQLRLSAPRLIAEAKAERAALDTQKKAMTAAGAEKAGADSYKGSSLPPPSEKEKEVQDAKQTMVLIMGCVKTLLAIVVNYSRAYQQAVLAAQQQAGQPASGLPPVPAAMPVGFTEEELRLLARCWAHGLRALKLAAYEAEPREMCEKFVEMLSPMDQKDFVEVVASGPRLAVLFSTLAEDGEVLHVVAHMLGPSTGPTPLTRVFLASCMDFYVAGDVGSNGLTGPFKALGNLGSREGAVALKVLKIMLATLLSIGPELEIIVTPALVRLMERSTRAAGRAHEPLGYLQVLRSIFKVVQVAGTKMKALTVELAPHLAPCLQLLTAMLNGPNTGDMRPLLLELCLSLPAQPALLPQLIPKQARPLLSAITQGPDELSFTALRTLDMWVDAFTPEIMEVALNDVLPELMAALWALLKPTSQLGAKALQLLGKLGGRNRRFLREPLRLDYKDNPEYGLRLILTFKPQMSFLTPLDKCMLLAKAALASPNTLVDATNDLYYRQQALRFLQVSLASVLNLRSTAEMAAAALGSAPAPQQAPPSGADAGVSALKVEGGESGVAPAAAAGLSPALQGAVDQLLEVLLGSGPVPSVRQNTSKEDLGVKTKTMLQAERNVLVALLAAVISAAADEALGETATPFARSICRHFGMLFAAGTQPPPPAPAMFRHMPDHTTPAPMPHGMRELGCHLFVNALLEVLCDKTPRRARAALDGLTTFLDTLLALHDARKKVAMHLKGQDPLPGAAALPAHAAETQPKDAEGGDAAAVAAAAKKAADADAGPATESGLPAVLDDLYSRILHCCADDAWQSQLAGAAAIKVLVHHPMLPASYLGSWAAPTLRALLAVMRALPAHSVVEAGEVQGTLLTFMRKALLNIQPPPYKHKSKDKKADAKEGHAATSHEAAAIPANAAGGSPAGNADATTAGSGSDASKPAPKLVVSPDSEWVKAVGDVLLSTVLNPNSRSRMRACAAIAMELYASALGVTTSFLAAGFIKVPGSEHDKDKPKDKPKEKEKEEDKDALTSKDSQNKEDKKEESKKEEVPKKEEAVKKDAVPAGKASLYADVVSRRLLPLKSVSYAVGTAEALTWVLKLDPPVLTWGPELLAVVEDALQLAERDESVTLRSVLHSRTTTHEMVTQLRVACMHLLCAVMMLPDFKAKELKQDDDPGAPSAIAAKPSDKAGEGGAAEGSAAAKPEAPADKDKSKDQGLRGQIAAVLFSALTQPSEDIWSAAKLGVSTLLLANPRVPKVTLQHGLRPLLQHLGDHRRLTLPMLQGLSRLLELLSEWFSHSLGVKLLEHLARWVTPEGPVGNKGTSSVAWKSGEEANIAAHILHLFHLLPKQAVEFLETRETRMGLVVLTIELEEQLPKMDLPIPQPRVMASPYRAPLTRYLNRYATEACTYFLEPGRICNERYLSRLLDIIGSTELGATELLKQLAASEDRLLPLLAIGCPEAAAAAGINPVVLPKDGEGGLQSNMAAQMIEAAGAYHTVHLVSVLAKLVPGWLMEHPRLLKALRARWACADRAKRVTNEIGLPRTQLLEGKRLAKAILRHVAFTHKDMDALFDLFSVFQARSAVSFQFLEEFCSRSVLEDWSDEDLHSLVMLALDKTAEGAYPQEQLERILQVLVLPVVSGALEKGRKGVVDSSVVDALAIKVLNLPATAKKEKEGSGSAAAVRATSAVDGVADAANTADCKSDSLQIELLKLTTCMLKHTPELWAAHSSSLMTYVFRLIRRDHTASSRGDNSVLLAHAHLAYAQALHSVVSQANEEYVTKAMVMVLRTKEGDGRKGLLRDALDLLLRTSLSKKASTGAEPPPATPGPAVAPGAGPRFLRAIKMVLKEDAGGSPGQLMHLWQVLLNHLDDLRPYRHHLVPYMMHTVQRLATAAQNNIEARRLAVDLVGAVVTWEEGRQAESSEEAGVSAATVPAPTIGSKRSRDPEGAGGASSADNGEPEAKAIKLEEGAAPSTSTAKATEGGSEGGAKPQNMDGTDSTWAVPIQLADQAVHFLLRLVLSLLGNSPDANKDNHEEVASAQKYAIALMGRAVRVWPNCNPRVAYIEKVLPPHMTALMAALQQQQQQQQQNNPGPLPCPSPPPALTVSLALMKVLLDVQSPHLLQCAHSQVAVLLEPCGVTRNLPTVQELAHIVKSVCAFQISEGQPGYQERVRVWADVETFINKKVQDAIETPAQPQGQMMQASQMLQGMNPVSTNPQALATICCCLHLLETLATCGPHPTRLGDVIQPYINLLVKLLTKLTREVTLHGQHMAQAGQLPPRRNPAPGSGTGETGLGPEYGTLAWAVAAGLRLCASRVMNTQDARKAVLQNVVGLLVGQNLRYYDPALFLELLLVVEQWIMRAPTPVDPAVPVQADTAAAAAAQGRLTHKEAILLAQRLGMLERNGLVGDPNSHIRAAFEAIFVRLMRVLLRDGSPDIVPPELRNEAFIKVERMFMMGMRSANPAVRREFFAMYDSRIPATLYDRLQFIILHHDWEACATQFWLKHALDLMFSVLREDDDILLAHNSSQAPPLLPNTKQNIFVPSLHMPKGQQPRNASAAATAGTADAKAEVKGEEGEAKGNGGGGVKEEPGAEAGQPVVKMEVDGDAVHTGTQPLAEGVVPAASAAAGTDVEMADAGAAGGTSAGDSTAAAAAGLQFVCTVPRDIVPKEVLEIVEKHAEFLQTAGQLRVRDLMHAMREYLHADMHVAYHLWVLMFPIVWATLDKTQQVTLAKPIISLMSKEYHHKQAQARPNVIQAMIDGIGVSQPQPKIPPELIKFLGKTFNGWQIAIPLLESHVVLFPQDSRCFDALAELYKLVNEEDMMWGLWFKRCNSEITRAALSLMQSGQLERAEEVVGLAVQGTVTGTLPMTVSRGEYALWVDLWVSCAKNLNHWDSLMEYARSTDNWELGCDCLWRLQDWNGLREVLQPNGKAAVEDTPQQYMIKAYVALTDGEVQTCEQRINQANVTTLHRWWQLPDVGWAPQVPLLQTAQQIVELRESLRLVTDLNNGNNINQRNGNDVARLQDYPFADVQAITAAWRSRTPNEWESLTHWQDVLVWRNHIYNIVISGFRALQDVNGMLHQLGYRDKAWSVNKLGAVATAHGLPETCLNILNTMYGYNAMEVQEAFVKIREQAKAYLDRPLDLTAGLNLLTTTNLDYFGAQHQAEIFSLKGSILAALKDAEAAHSSLSTALALWKGSAEAWLAWGQLCDEQWDTTNTPPGPGMLPPVPQPFLLEYAVHCILQGVRLGNNSARALIPRLLHLLSFDNDGPGQQMMAAAQAAGMAAHTMGNWQNVVGGALERSGGLELPSWVWVGWLPQLLVSLMRREAGVVKKILLQMSQDLPQALFYPLRTMLIALREGAFRSGQDLKQREAMVQQINAALERAKASVAEKSQTVQAVGLDPAEVVKQPAGGNEAVVALKEAHQKQQQVEVELQHMMISIKTLRQCHAMESTAFESGREVNDQVRAHHTAVASTLDIIVSELSVRFSPRQEERLLAVVYALLHRCYKVPFAANAAVPPPLCKELAGVCKACFDTDKTSTTGGRNRSSIVASMRDEFVQDLNPDSPKFPVTLGALLEHLKQWRARLLSELEDRMPPVLRLEEETPVLRELPLNDVEMPGAYAVLLGGGDPPPWVAPLPSSSAPQPSSAHPTVTPHMDGPVLLEAIGATVSIVRRQGATHRRLALHGSDGRTRHMIIQQSQNWQQASVDERQLQAQRAFNRLLDLHPQSRSRALGWYVPVVVPVIPTVRLLEEDPSFASYGEAYDVNCMRFGREADMPILYFKRRCASEMGQLGPGDQNSQQVRQFAFTEICDKIVSDNVFSQYIYKTLPSHNHLWVFKKMFCTQMALSGLLCHMLLLGGRAPPKILFAKDTGRVLQVDLMPMYSDKGMLERSEMVPFRLTRNMTNFFTAFGVEGVFVTAMVNAAQALLQKHSNVQHVLSLLFRDDITAWSARKGPSKAAMVGTVRGDALKGLVGFNTRKTLERVRQLAPQVGSEDYALIVMQTPELRSCVVSHALEMVELAMNPKNLCRMDPVWHPWF